MFKLIPEWKTAHKLWTVQVAVLGMIATAALYALPAFMGAFQPMTYAALCVGFCVLQLVARLADQPGVPG